MTGKGEKMIEAIIRCPNNMVIVFDGEGEQVPEYQGQYEEVKENILKDAPPDAIFALLSNYEPELHKIPREEW